MKGRNSNVQFSPFLYSSDGGTLDVATTTTWCSNNPL